MCTSSMMYTLYFPTVGMYLIFSRSSRISSMPRLEAPSISCTSIDDPPMTSTQLGHALQGVPGSPCTQLIAFANTRATEVFPTPLAPPKRYAWAILPPLIAFIRVWVMCSWPATS